MEEKSCNFLGFVPLSMKSHMMIEKYIIWTNDYGYFAFLSQKCGFWTKIISPLKSTHLLQKQQ